VESTKTMKATQEEVTINRTEIQITRAEEVIVNTNRETTDLITKVKIGNIITQRINTIKEKDEAGYRKS